MKHFFKYIFGITAAVLMTTSCETTELDLRDNPNALTPEQADLNLFLNAIQLKYVDLMESLSEPTSETVRILTMQNRQYVNAYSPEFFNGDWDDAYRELLADVAAMNVIAEEGGFTKHIAIGQVLTADVFTTLVDIFGDIPFSEAIQGREGNLNPKRDSGADIYAAALDLLDQAIDNFNGPGSNPSLDFFYDRNWTRWIKLANTMKLKLLLKTRLVNSSALTEFQAIVNSGNYIQTNAEDFQFRWGTNEVQPDTRHPNYAQNYIPQGAGDYAAHWIIQTMRLTNDPRIRYYFFRQTDAVPGQDSNPPNEETLDCSLDTPRQHYIDFYTALGQDVVFCGLPDGYWGRDHGDDAGIPPDGLLRTTWGVYPVAGNFDDDRFKGIGQGQGGGGAGITPLLLSSWVDFWKAEVAMVNNNPTLAKQYMLEGIAKHIAKVQSFGSLDTAADSDFFTDANDSQDFQDEIEAAFDDGSINEKWNILAEQFFVTQYGYGIDAYNFYKRVGFPFTLQPSLEPNPGGFIRLFRYPSNHTNNNSNAQQRQSVTEQTFWDTNPSSPGFPVAN